MDKKHVKHEQIVDYVENRLDEKMRTNVEQHLFECDSCFEKFIIFNGVVRSGEFDSFDPVPIQVTERAIRIAKQYREKNPIDDLYRFLTRMKSEWRKAISGLWPWYGLQFASVRGSRTVVSDDLLIIKKCFSEFDAEIEIEKSGDDKACIEVTVVRKGRGSPIRVSLLRNKREISSYLSNGSSALFEDIPFDHYSILFTKDGVKIGEYLFEIREGKHGRE